MGPAELHLIARSPLNFCCLLGRISQPLLNESSRMQISRGTVRPGSHQLFLNAATLWLSTLGAAARGLEQTGQFVWEDLTAQE